MKLPLEKRLRKKLHVDIALLQDELVELLYSIAQNLVLHGGTAIWRCYKGNRFSEDLDFYGKLDEALFKEKLKERNLTIKKFKRTKNLIFSKICCNNAEVRIEINMAKYVKRKVVAGYEKVDGSFIDVYTLSVDDLIDEKIDAYLHRRFIRDLYDIYHLVRTFDVSPETKKKLSKFFPKIKKPVDEKILKSIVYSGAVPSFNAMVKYLERII